MMHNPFQSYQTDPTFGAYAGMANPFSLPYTAMQASVTNPATLNPLASALGASCPTAGLSQLGQTGYAGIPSYGSIHPQQLQLASLLTSQAAIPQVFGQNPLWQQQNPYSVGQNPWITGGLQNPLLAGLQNPLLTAGLQNPLLTAGLQNPLLNPFAQQQFGLQQFQHPLYQQLGQGLPFGQQGLPYGQIGSPFGQQGLPYGQIGLPQTWQQQQPLQAYSPYQQIGQGSPFGLQGSPYTSQGSPYTQTGSPFAQPNLPYGQIGSPLAPQSWVGQAGPFAGGQGFGQIHPLVAQQLAARAFHSQGISPWLGF
jgi:hypothetical protein